MTMPRSKLVSLESTPYYHCISRCVRRAFLCGKDRYTSRDFSHRRGWIVDRIKLLSRIFTIDICAYAVMSNHYHLVLKVDRDSSEQLSDGEVIERWCMIFKGPVLVQRFRAGECLTEPEKNAVFALVSVWRNRLSNISWYMRCLNEHVARMANAEDGCKGRFWEGRFKSQALLDEVALLACMSYVDLNPIRAGAAEDLHTSVFTSIAERLKVIRQATISNSSNAMFVNVTPRDLAPFKVQGIGGLCSEQGCAEPIPYALKDYLQLVEWMGRSCREDKAGFISASVPPILISLQLDPKTWLVHVNELEQRYFNVIGSPKRITRISEKLNYAWLKGSRQTAQLYRKAI